MWPCEDDEKQSKNFRQLRPSVADRSFSKDLYELCKGSLLGGTGFVGFIRFRV